MHKKRKPEPLVRFSQGNRPGEINAGNARETRPVMKLPYGTVNPESHCHCAPGAPSWLTCGPAFL